MNSAEDKIECTRTMPVPSLACAHKAARYLSLIQISMTNVMFSVTYNHAGSTCRETKVVRCVNMENGITAMKQQASLLHLNLSQHLDAVNPMQSRIN